jgi:hypothetical protein
VPRLKTVAAELTFMEFGWRTDGARFGHAGERSEIEIEREKIESRERVGRRRLAGPDAGEPGRLGHLAFSSAHEPACEIGEKYGKERECRRGPRKKVRVERGGAVPCWRRRAAVVLTGQRPCRFCGRENERAREGDR